MKGMRFFVIIFAIFVSLASSSFLLPEKVFAQNATSSDTVYTCPDGVTKYYDPADRKNCPQVITWVTQDDLTRWKASASASFSKLGLAADGNFQTKFNAFAQLVYTLYNGDQSVTKTQAFGYILSGIPEEKLTTGQIALGFGKGMFGFTQSVINNKSETVSNIEMAKQVETALTQMLGNESALQTLAEQGGTTNANATAAYAQYTDGLNNATQDSTAASQAKQKASLKGESKCTINWKDGVNIGGCIDAFFAWIITHTLLALAGWLLWATATMMNYAINIGILGFSAWAPDSIYPIWLVIRQIVSLFLVFAGLWLGFMYMINKGDEFKKYIPSVVIFALFVNFSYPLTRTIIDFSNIISLNIYASAVGASSLDSPMVAITGENTAGKKIMNKLGLAGVVDYATGNGTIEESGAGALNSINSVGPALAAVAFILYAAWIFFVISTLLITRTAVLAFIIIASPLLLVDKVIPKLGDAAVKIRSVFIEMLAVGPVFSIMLALTLKFLEVFSKGSKLSELSGSSGTSAITLLFNMIMMLIMLHIMYKVTKSTSGEIGKAVSGFTEKVAGTALGTAAFGGLGMAGRFGVGGLARAAQKSGINANGTGWMQKDNMMSRMAFRAAGAAAEGSYDARNTSFVKWGGQKLGIGAMGTPTTKGYTALKEEKDKKKRQFDAERANFTQKAIKTREARIREEYNAIEGEQQRAAYITKNLKATEDASLIRSLKNEDYKKENTEIEKAVSDWKLRAGDQKKQDEFYMEQNEAVQRRIEDGIVKEREEKAYKTNMLNAQKAIASALNNQKQNTSGPNTTSQAQQGTQSNQTSTSQPNTASSGTSATTQNAHALDDAAFMI